MSDVTVASTTDTQESVNLAAGLPAEPAETQADNETPTESYEGESREQDESAAASETAPTESEAARGKPDKKLLKRIDKLTAEKYGLKEQNEELRRRLDDLERRVTAKSVETPANKTDQAAAKPTPDKFATYEEYVEALADWKSEQKFKEQLNKAREAEAQQSLEERTKQTFDAYNKQLLAARSKYEDFDQIVGRDDIQIPQSAQVAIVEAENGAEIAYYLGKHPEVCETLMAMTPARAVIEVGRISAKLNPEETQTSRSQERRPTSSAPAPIRPVGGSSTRSAVPLDELDYREYRRLRDQQRRH